MSMRYKGSRLSATANTPTSLTASGAWTLQQQMQANGTSTWPFVRDPQFNYVTMLLHGDGSAGANNGSGAGVTPTVTNFNADASTNNFNLTINGDARSNNFNPYQSGYYSNYFDGSSYLAISNGGGSALDMGTGNCTIEMWVNPATQTTSFPSMFAPASGWSTGTFYIRYSNTGYANKFGVFWNSVGDPFFVSTNTYAPNAWYHVALVRSGSTFTLYINGVADGTGTSSASLNLAIGGSVWLGNNGSASCNFTGYLSNVRVVKGTAVYTSNFTPSTTPLTAISGTSLLTAQSNRFIDTSSNALAITTSGSPQVAPAQPFTLPSSVATYGSGYFDGTGDKLITPASSAFNFGTGDFTIEMWVYPNATIPTYGDAFFLMDSRTNASWSVFLSSGKLYFSNSGGTENNGGTIASFTWSHVAVSRVSGTTKGFINGVQAFSFSDSGNYTSSPSLTIGARYVTTGTTDLNGYLSNVRIINGTGLYTTTFTPPTSPLAAVSGTSLLTTQYNGGGNNSGFKDSSQNNFAITRNGNTTQGTFAPYGSNWSNYFNASASRLEVVNSNSSMIAQGTAFTLESWVFINSSTATGNNYNTSIPFLCSSTSSSSTSNGRLYSFGTTTFGFWDRASAGWLTISWTPPIGQWFHLALVSSGTVFTLYINGTSVGSVTDTTTYYADSTWNFYIAAYTGNGTAGTPPVPNMYISNFRYTKAQIYTSTFTPSTTPLTAIANTTVLTCQSNRFIDNSTNAYTINALGTTTPSVQRFSPFANATAYNPATLGGSAYFAGSTTNYLNTPASTQFLFNGNFTIEGWFYKNATGTFGGLFGNYTANASSNWTVQLGSSNQLTWYYDSAGVSIASTFVVGQWNHVACVRNGSTLTMYLNGVSVGTATFSTAYGSSSKPFLIGTANSDCINGYVSDVRVVNGTALYTGTFTPPTAPLTAVTNTQFLLSNTNSAILDQSMMNDLETVGNAQISTSVVKYGTASMYFNGSGNYLVAPVSKSLGFDAGNLTIEGWGYVTSTSATYQCMLSIGAPVQIYARSGTIEVYFNDSDDQSTYIVNGMTGPASSVSANTWFHFAVVRNGTTFTAYVNGVAGTPVTGVSAAVALSATPFMLGTYGPSPTTYPLTGYIDDLRITKGYARYTANFTPPTQALPNG